MNKFNLDLVSATEGGDVDKEIDEASKYKDDLFKAMILCEEALSSKEKKKEKEPVVIKEALPVPTVKKYVSSCQNSKKRLCTESV